MERKNLEEVGEISHYYTRIGVAIVEVRAPISVGDRILIRGLTTNLEQNVTSMQMEHKNITKAKAGQSIGLKVEERVRNKDIVYKIL